MDKDFHLLNELYSGMYSEEDVPEEKKKPDADGDGVPDWADKKPGKDDHAEDDSDDDKQVDEASTIDGESKGSSWKQTGLSYEDAVSEYGKENVKRQKNEHGNDVILVKEASTIDGESKGSSWKQTGLSYEDAVSKYGKENVKKSTNEYGREVIHVKSSTVDEGYVPVNVQFNQTHNDRANKELFEVYAESTHNTKAIVTHNMKQPGLLTEEYFDVHSAGSAQPGGGGIDRTSGAYRDDAAGEHGMSVNSDGEFPTEIDLNSEDAEAIDDVEFTTIMDDELWDSPFVVWEINFTYHGIPVTGFLQADSEDPYKSHGETITDIERR